MARMMPKINSKTIANRGEQLAYPLFRDQLPNDWVVIYDYKFCVMVDHQLKDGQIDFIIIAPQKGILFVEVKGSYGLRLDAEDETCGYRISKNGGQEKLSKTPFTQVDEHKHNVINQILCERLGKNKFPGIYGHAVFYPQGKLVNTPPSQATQVFWGYIDKNNLHSKCVSAFRNVRPLKIGEAFTHEIMERVVEIFEDHEFVPIAKAAESDEFNRIIDKLTINQFNTIQGLLQSDLKRAVIKGQAGSGKTMLALWTAAHFTSLGLKTLFLCKNKGLKEWISQNNLCNGFDLYTFQGLCPKLDPNWDKHNINEAGFWDERVPEILCDLIDHLPENKRYDAIVVDEGQDFHPQWWIPVELLLSDENLGKLFIFCDPNQKIQYEGQLRFPDVEIEYYLTANCRNPQKIKSYCGNVLGVDLQSMLGMPVGVEPRILTPIPNTEGRCVKCLSQIKSWLDEGFKTSRIAILSPYNSRNEKGTLYKLKNKSLHNKRFEDNSDQIKNWLNGDMFWMSSIKAFKGLEADCILLTDVPSDDIYFSENDFYVGISRAKHQALIIPCDNQAHARARRYLKAYS
ncbi:MAG TPA: hypothetical protein DCY03_27265 [Planctomycetaceae bacterium]|nr:hypothetical protein [Planctomycetaceae bacterium]|tara:strand:- start:1322 stop:3034 length:1713 start_codon:yes stop_codon:yes gene_type:complete